MNIPEDLRYADNHEWSRVEDDGTITIGISDFAQDALGDIVYVDLPDVGAALVAGETFGEIESTKSVSDVYAPLNGSVVAVNVRLDDEPELINASPYGDGWMIVVQPTDVSDLDSLMDASAYERHTTEA